ncbi:GNAT family N-acetyltransferase [Rhodococcoides kyotonense]|uniref:Ribosomal-protein-alanine N-acetyltransferase n=1 Tax=Rhodococcoides kyotonense TaxID=398843 RepID=A0A239MG81_9NOCA|nr:GNAT family protein [Rhodococcus kyotonensis]SNT40819.1 ribosomal-protein-alanine N-acetyltransferase [Rhodococcus kyotonensis]
MRQRSQRETVARFYVGRVRDRLTARQTSRKTTLIGLTPTGRVVTLRPPRVSDADAWRRIRLRDQAAIEPFWSSSTLGWTDRHTEAIWIRECLQSRLDTAAGRALPLVIDVDGQFAGQCNLEWIDAYNGTAEIGIWVDSAQGRSGVGATAVSVMLAHAFGALGLHRISAPVSVTNAVAKNLFKKAGLAHEGTMRDYMDVGGVRRDHELWAVTNCGQ